MQSLSGRRHEGMKLSRANSRIRLDSFKLSEGCSTCPSDLSPLKTNLQRMRISEPDAEEACSSPTPCFSPSKPFAFFPSVSEFRHAVCLLDMDKDGKIWEQDLDMLLELAFGVELRTGNWTTTLDSPGDLQARNRDSWREFKHSCECRDGLISLDSVLKAMELGVFQDEVSKIRRSQRKGSPDRVVTRRQESSTQRGYTLGSLPAFKSLVDYVATFNKFDCDSNGVICAKDLQYALKGYTGVEFSVKECKEMIQKIDGNCDGVVELGEFGALMRYLGT